MFFIQLYATRYISSWSRLFPTEKRWSLSNWVALEKQRITNEWRNSGEGASTGFSSKYSIR